jgi:hypothetical protein
MFRENVKHRQYQVLTTLDSLRPQDRDRLEGGWSGTFYREFFCRMDEALLAPLYSDAPSRPNVPVNVLMALEVLKSGFGWTDEELFDQFTYNVQVRRAVGYPELGEGHFDVRTLYNFRRRLSEYARETGVDLVEKVFEQVTDEQLAVFHLKAGRLRMDSTLVSSNVRVMSRLHFLVEVIQRVHEMLSETDQWRYREEFSAYVQGTAGRFVYWMRSEEGRDHVQRLGELMGRLVGELGCTYGDDPGYAILKRVYEEQFVVEEGGARPRHGKEVPRVTLQSLADPEATYRQKGGRAYIGYVVNVTETCEPDNPVQLIAKVQVDPNVRNDSTLMSEVVGELKERLGVQELYTDGGYDNEETGRAVRAAGVEHLQSALKGTKPSGLSLTDFPVGVSESGELSTITCPEGRTVAIREGKQGSHTAHFEGCGGCRLGSECPTKVVKRDGARRLHFTTHDWEVACIRRRLAQNPERARALRGPIEPTIRSLKRTFPGGDLPVRGLRRAKQMVTEAAAMINIRRIERAMMGGKGSREAQVMLMAHAGLLIGRVSSFLHRLMSSTQTLATLSVLNES